MHRRIQLYVDDYGYRKSTDRLIEKYITQRKIVGYAVLANFYLQTNINKKKSFLNNQSVGVHINFVEGKSVSDPQDIASLVDRNGQFYSFPIFYFRLLFGFIEKKELMTEASAQIALILKTGAVIDEINSHQHTHALSPVAEIVEDLAANNNIPRVRSYQFVTRVTTRAKIMFYLLRLLSFLSHVKYSMRLCLPISWKKVEKPISFMSWESHHLHYKSLLPQTTLVIHPKLGFDKNLRYEKML